MSARFYVDGFGNLMAEMDGERDSLMGTRFNQTENKEKAIEYLKVIAAEMTKLYVTDPAAAEAVLTEAEYKIGQAQAAEKFLEEVTF